MKQAPGCVGKNIPEGQKGLQVQGAKRKHLQHQETARRPMCLQQVPEQSDQGRDYQGSEHVGYYGPREQIWVLF